MSFSLIYQLQGASYSSLNAEDFKIGVVDADDNGMNATQISALEAAGKTLYAYVSVGEAEDYRDYWVNNNWSSNRPSFVLGENPDWPGNYNVKFWDNTWQQLMVDRVKSMVALGYQGAYLDIIDAYQVDSVIAAFNASGQSGTVRQAMENFVIKLSNASKALNPNFKIIPQNAVELFATNTLDNVGDTLIANTRYLDAIDGVGKEDTFSNDDDYPVDYTEFDQAYIQVAMDHGKFVLATDYPTSSSLRQTVLNESLAAGYIPFIGVRDLDDNLLFVNEQTPGRISADVLGGGLVSVPPNSDLINSGTTGSDRMTGGEGNDVLRGNDGADSISGGNAVDYLYGEAGNDSLTGGQGSDVLDGGADRDTLVGGGGNDVLMGGDGGGSISGGAGHDDLTGGAGLDTLTGGTGNDHIYGGAEADSLHGGDGNDTLSGEAGTDVLDGAAGNDRMDGGAGVDTLYGRAGNDFLFGGEDNDTLYGGDDADTLIGGEGVNQLYGEGGNDFLIGGNGNDVMTGGAGNDVLIGRGGADQFVYNFASGADTIRDFIVGHDHMQLVGFASGFAITATFANVVAPNLVYANGGATITFSASHSLHFDNIVSGSLAAGDFIFTG